MRLDLAFHCAANPIRVLLRGEILDIDDDFRPSCRGAGVFASSYLSDDDLVGEFHQQMVLSRVGPPASIEHIDAIQDKPHQADGIDGSVSIPVSRLQLGMTTDTVDDDFAPKNPMTERRNPIASRLCQDPSV